MTTAISAISSGNAHAAPFDPAKGAARLAAKVFSDLDANKDDKITKDEFVTGLTSKGLSADDAIKRFNAIDKNETGSITKSDVETAITNGTFGPPRSASGAGGPPGAGGPGGQGGAQPAGSGSSTTTYAAADTNQDGTVSAQEQLIYDFSHSDQKATDSSKLGNNINQLA